MIAGGSQSAWALSGSLADMNTRVGLDDTGMVDWEVNGIDHMVRQWFWLRIGDTGPEVLLDQSNFSETFATFPAPAPFGVFANYVDTDTMLNVTLLDTVMGGTPNSKWSDIAQTVRLMNLGPRTLDVHLFQFVDLDLGGTPEGDTVGIRPNVVRQGQVGGTALPGGDNLVVEMSMLLAPDKYELGDASDLLARLTDGNPTELANTCATGSGDMGWAFQWDLTLHSYNGVAIISEDLLMHHAPEPVTMLSLGMCVAAIGGYVRRRRKAAA